MLQKDTTSKVLSVFFREPTKKHYLKGIARDVNIAHPSVSRVLKELLKEEMIKRESERKGKRTFPTYIANKEEDSFKIYKKTSNLASIYQSGLVKFLTENLAPKSIVLFGSYSNGEDIEESDIDLFVQCKEKEINSSKYEKLLGRKINIYFNEEISKIPLELRNNIINGIVLFGYVEAFK
jgi:predicted nucleotidyltransferase